MDCSSTSHRAPIPVPCCAAIEPLHGSAGVIPKRRRSYDGCPQTHPAGFRGAAGLVLVSVLLVAMAAASASADPSRPGDVRPDEADLRYYFDCSKVAATRLLSFEEATGCARTFMRIKLSFVPGVGLDDFDRLPPREKAAVNLVGYRRYMDWVSENAAEVEALRNAPLSSSAFAAN